MIKISTQLKTRESVVGHYLFLCDRAKATDNSVPPFTEVNTIMNTTKEGHLEKV